MLSTLRDLLREAKANEAAFRARVRTVLRSSYSNHYRRMLPRLLAALDFRCNNTAYRPVMDAVGLLRRYAERERVQFYDETALAGLSSALAADTTGGVRIGTRTGQVWITVPRPPAQDEPPGLQALKDEVARRWGTVDLLDLLKETDLLTAFTDEFTSVASREIVPRDVLRRRLLLALFALGTNMGIRRIVATGEHAESEASLRRAYVTPTSTARTCAARSSASSTPPSSTATPIGGAAGPRARRTPSALGPGNRTS